MLCLPDYGRPYLIDSLTTPVVIKHHWIFNACVKVESTKENSKREIEQLSIGHPDFVLQQITYLEETTGAVVKLRVNNSEFWVPATWNILVTDRETYQLDTVCVSACASTGHLAFSFSPDEMNLRTLDIAVVDYCESMSLVHPMINKGCALVHPVGPAPTFHGKQIQLNVVIGPHDLYKHLQNKVVGDLISY
jgi:hypothetical protein